eukprot:scaffold23550_cov79-Isochrysis_galbana.AAC.1
MLVDETGAPSSPSYIRGSMRAVSTRAAAYEALSPDASLRAPDKSPARLSAVCGTPEYFAPELVELAQGKASHDSQAGTRTRPGIGRPA